MTKIPRRYKNPKHPAYRAYNEAFDRALIGSKVFNQSDYPTLSSIYWDRQRILAEISITEKEIIPDLEKRLTGCNERFESYCIQQVNSGRDRPEDWPTQLLDERAKLEAMVDLRKREVEFLKEKLEQIYLKPEQKRAEDAMLAYGSIGTGRLQDGVLVEIDGQPCGFTADGILIITKGPYEGMRVADYRRYIVTPYVEERNRRLRKLTDQRTAEIKSHGSTNIPLRD